MTKLGVHDPQQAIPANPVRTPSVRWALASLSLSMLLSSLGTSIANVGLPTLAQAFNASFQEVQWIVLAYLLAITTLIVSVGRASWPHRRPPTAAAGRNLSCSRRPRSWCRRRAHALGLLIAARAAQGLGAAIMMALSMAFVGDTVPSAGTGSAMGLLGTMSGALARLLGPSLGGVLIAGLGWRADLPRQRTAGLSGSSSCASPPARGLPRDRRLIGPGSTMWARCCLL